MDDVSFFETAEAFREWLLANHDKADVLRVGYYKKGTRRLSITYPESVDEALCFGWIDGVRHSLGVESYTVRFTPRRPRSIWSGVNLKRMEQLLAEGRVHQAGKAIYEARDPAKDNLYSYERENAVLTPEYEEQFKADEKAWEFFSSQPPGYRRTCIWWVMSAKQDATRQRRLESLIKDSAAGRRIAAMEPRKT